MTIYFISRHPGAIAWARQQKLEIDRLLSHLDPAMLQPGDWVIGTLPVNLAAEVCARGGRYFNLSLNLRPEQRGKELNLEELLAAQARLEEFLILKAQQPLVGSGLHTPDH